MATMTIARRCEREISTPTDYTPMFAILVVYDIITVRKLRK